MPLNSSVGSQRRMSEVISIIFLLIGFGCAAFCTGKAIYHMYHIVTNVSGRYANFLGPFALIVPGQLTKEGERHRKPLGVALLGVAFGWFVLFAIGAVRG